YSGLCEGRGGTTCMDMRGRARWLRPRALFGDSMCLLHLPLNLAVNRIKLRLSCRAVFQQRLPESQDRAARLPFLDLFACAVGVIAHALGVGTGAVRLALQQGRPTTGSRATNCLVRGTKDGKLIVPVNFNARHSVGSTATGDTRIARGIFKWNFGRK